MSFLASGLTPLIQTSSFSLWHYRTDDIRTDVTAAGYFNPVAAQLKPGDLMILQTADAMALLPLRSGPATGPGVTLDGAVSPLTLLRSAAQNFTVTQAVGAVVRTIVLAPLAAGFITGGSIPVSAQVQGPISQVLVSVRDSSNQIMPTPQIVTVSGGYATAAIPVPPVGTGYRIRVEDVQDPAIAAVSRTFSVTPPLDGIQQENLSVILMENGYALLRDNG